MNQNKWNKNRKVYFKMSAKNVRNVSIFHISSCQTTCQGINPNKLNNNFLIKLNIFILLRLFGRPNCYWRSDVRKSCSNLLIVYDSSVISIHFTPVNSEKYSEWPKSGKLRRLELEYRILVVLPLYILSNQTSMESLSQWRHQYGQDGMHE